MLFAPIYKYLTNGDSVRFALWAILQISIAACKSEYVLFVPRLAVLIFNNSSSVNALPNPSSLDTKADSM